MPQSKIKKAVVATVNYAGFEFPGLKLPDGQYGIAVPQIVNLIQKDTDGFRPSTNTASRDFKRLLGRRFCPSKISTELNNAKINVVSIEIFALLMLHLAVKGIKIAEAIAETSITMSLEQAFDLAFDNKQSLEEYQKKQATRTQGKLTRRKLTDSIKDYLDNHSKETSENYKKWIYPNCSDAINRIVFGLSSKKLREKWECKDPRDAMTFEELTIVEGVERLTMTLIDEKEYEPLSAVKEAGERLLIKKIQR